MKKVYQKPNAEFLNFALLDEITTDDDFGDIGAGDSGGYEEW